MRNLIGDLHIIWIISMSIIQILFLIVNMGLWGLAITEILKTKKDVD